MGRAIRSIHLSTKDFRSTGPAPHGRLAGHPPNAGARGSLQRLNKFPTRGSAGPIMAGFQAQWGAPSGCALSFGFSAVRPGLSDSGMGSVRPPPLESAPGPEKGKGAADIAGLLPLSDPLLGLTRKGPRRRRRGLDLQTILSAYSRLPPMKASRNWNRFTKLMNRLSAPKPVATPIAA